MRSPPLLAAGARVALLAPSGPLRGREDIDRAEASVRRMSWEPVLGSHVLEREGYLAGTDRHRLADLNRVAADDSIDAVWCIRGGYGAMRLLDGIDYAAWRRRPKALIGYSDITALHVAIGARAELVTFHAPTARETMTGGTADSFARALARGVDPLGVAPGATTLTGGRARGRLAGGNLALLGALCGTPYAPSLDGAILVLEDVNEHVYRIDRVLTQLRLAGTLARVAAIAFGQFTEIPADPGDTTVATNSIDAAPSVAQPPRGDRSLDVVLRECAHMLGIPCIAGIPMGHVREQWTLPLGAMAELDADATELRLV